MGSDTDGFDGWGCDGDIAVFVFFVDNSIANCIAVYVWGFEKTVHSGFLLGGVYNSFGGIQRFICTLLLPRLSFVPLLFVSMCCHPPLLHRVELLFG